MKEAKIVMRKRLILKCAFFMVHTMYSRLQKGNGYKG